MIHSHTFLSLLSALLLCTSLLSAQTTKNDRYYHLLVGTYTSGKSEGIYVYRFDSKTGEVTPEFIAKGVENPSFLTVSPDSKFVYAVNEFSGEKPGMVSAFDFNAKTGELKFINKQPSGGGDPCYLSIDQNQKNVIVANYTGGSLSALPVNKDGSLQAPVQTIQHEGSSVNKGRQEKAHVHSVKFTPSEDYLFVGDLGMDEVFAYEYNPDDKDTPLKPAKIPFTKVKPGTGPRHIIFSKEGKFAYLIKELSAEVNVFKHNGDSLTLLQTIPMTDDSFKGELGAAEIRLSPDGKFLYASNRGDANDIVVYKVDQEKGTLTFVQRQSTLGKNPRNFLIDPTGNFVIVAHQNSDNLVWFKRDMKSGKLSPLNKEIEIGNPVYLKMVPVQ